MSCAQRSPRQVPVAPQEALAALEVSDLDYFERSPRRRRRLRWIDAVVLNAYMRRGEDTWRFSEKRGWECAAWPRFPAGTRAFVVSDYSLRGGGQITQRVFLISGAQLLEMERITFSVADLRRRRNAMARSAP